MAVKILATASLVILWFIAGCNAQPVVVDEPVVVEENKNGVTTCSDPRPKFCNRMYAPVCATRDTGIRCVTTPCDSTEKMTFSNACVACADPKVYYHEPGKCTEPEPEAN